MMLIPCYLLYSNIVSALQSHRDLVNPSNQEHGNHQLEDQVQGNAFHQNILAGAPTSTRKFWQLTISLSQKIELATYPGVRFSAPTLLAFYYAIFCWFRMEPVTSAFACLLSWDLNISAWPLFHLHFDKLDMKADSIRIPFISFLFFFCSLFLGPYLC